MVKMEEFPMSSTNFISGYKVVENKGNAVNEGNNENKEKEACIDSLQFHHIVIIISASVLPMTVFRAESAFSSNSSSESANRTN